MTTLGDLHDNFVNRVIYIANPDVNGSKIWYFLLILVNLAQIGVWDMLKLKANGFSQVIVDYFVSESFPLYVWV